ncbi:hypothetical protein [Phnomibacter sp. MR]|uniref:hypothetical protein n=1 Tax=Phnomibacter sp. MR TaxID=3042318 RepID=UPI003A80A121
MQKIILLVATFVFSFQAVTGQADGFQNKSKTELLQFIKDSIETYGNFMGIDYLVSYADHEPNHLRIGEISSGDTVWYKVDLSLAKMGASVSILPTGKENFIITFKKEITTKEKNNKNATLDVFFFRKKDKRETDYAQLIENFTYAFTFLIPQCKT